MIQEKIQNIFEEVIKFCKSDLLIVKVKYNPEIEELEVGVVQNSCCSKPQSFFEYKSPNIYEKMFHKWSNIEKKIKKMCDNVCEIMAKEDKMDNLPCVEFKLNLQTNEVSCNANYKY